MDTRVDRSDHLSWYAPLVQDYRCVVMAERFVEWDRTTKPYTVYEFGLRSGEDFGMAGLWREHENGIAEFLTLTTVANDLVAQVYDAMPCVLEDRDIDSWLLNADGQQALDQLKAPYPSAKMMMTYVFGPGPSQLPIE